ncbi:MAG TPA: hypothetical protein PLL50_12320, partial [Propionicimonas sp.]|nr:hypothetical protein [Propionicimonas sp.]HQA79120.1 hypothetical protein [Propionicimonas sp.]
MSVLGEWAEATDDNRPSVGTVSVAGVSVDVTGLAQDLVRKTILSEVRAQVRDVVTPVIADAVAKALTP